MDEPTNHLDIESIIWLERFLKTLPAALLMTSHDREFMNRMVTEIAEIDSVRLLCIRVTTISTSGKEPSGRRISRAAYRTSKAR
jgi:ATPase subunit of ABC transporter with duplicated ATPase domains